MHQFKWLFSWFRQSGLIPGRYFIFLLGIFIGSLPTETQPFLYAYWEGPIHLRVFTWAATILLILSLLRELYDRVSHRKIPRAAFFRENASAQLADWNADSHWLHFDGNFEVAVAPNLFEPDRAGAGGWQPTDVLLKVGGAFPNAPRLEQNYQSWRERTDPKKLEKDGVKYVLRNHPTSETDEHFIRLHLQTTHWSRVQAFMDLTRREGREVLFTTADPRRRPNAKPELNLEWSECPQSIGLHCVVITSDEKLLALQRPGPERTDYYPYMWSFSFEEQLSESDFPTGSSETDVGAWIRRAVRQEVLGQEVDRYFNVDDARVLSLLFEEEVFNPSFVALTPVRCSSIELATILPHAPDRAEWLRYDFYSLTPPYDALVAAFSRRAHVDGQGLHPTSRYRIYSTLAVRTPPSLVNVVELLTQASKRREA